MRTLVLLSVLLPAVANAADESKTDVDFHAETQLFRGTQWSQFFPEDSSLSARFSADMDTFVTIDMVGENHLDWPEGEVQSGWNDIKQPGIVTLVADAKMTADVAVDLWGFNFTYSIWSREFTWEQSESFQSLLLPENETNSVSVAIDKTEFNVIDEYYEVDYGVFLTFSGDVAPQNSATITGEKIRTNRRNVETIDAVATLDGPEENDGMLDMESMWYGNVTSSFAVDVTPTIGLCHDWFGCFEVPFTYNWHIADDERQIKSEMVNYELEIPAIDMTATTLDFGDVTVGETVTMDVQIGALSNATLLADAVVDQPVFDVGTGSIIAINGQDGTLTVSFTPDSLQDHYGTVTIHTNDPTTDEVTIALSGTGVELPVEDPNDPTDTDDGGEYVDDLNGGCGCSSTSTGGPAGFAVLGLGMLGLIRRRV